MLFYIKWSIFAGKCKFYEKKSMFKLVTYLHRQTRIFRKNLIMFDKNFILIDHENEIILWKWKQIYLIL